MKKGLQKAMSPSNKRQKKIYPPYMDGKKLLCSRCFNPLGSIEKYGHDDKGYWFIAPCKICQAKMKWYRRPDGTAQAESPAKEDGTFGLTLVDGIPTLTLDN